MLAIVAKKLCVGPERGLLLRVRVPSQHHEILVEMFRNRPALARDLLAQVAGVRVGDGLVELASVDLSQALAVEYRADAVTVVRDRRGRPACAVIVEVQIRIDRSKRLTWPLYVAALRARLDCSVVLLVITPDDAVAAWARLPIELGHPGFALSPIAIGFSDIPRITDREIVRRTPELGVLSVMAHRDLDIALVVAPEILEQPEQVRQVYLDLIYSALPDAAERALKELLMGKYEYQSRTVRAYLAQGREQGREEGLREAVLEFVRAKLGVVPAGYEQAVRNIGSDADLTTLIAELGRADTHADVEAVFARLVSRT